MAAVSGQTRVCVWLVTEAERSGTTVSQPCIVCPLKLFDPITVGFIVIITNLLSTPTLEPEGL